MTDVRSRCFRAVRLPLLVALLVLLAGCSAPLGADTPTSTPTPAGPQALTFPGFPASLTADTAGAHAASYEEVYRHNAILASNEGVTSISVNCDPATAEPSGDVYLVTVSCGFSWMFEEDGAVGVADGRPYEATYRIGGGLTERVGSTL